MRTVRAGLTVGLVAQLSVLLVLAGTVGLDLAGWIVGVTVGMASNGLLTRGLVLAGPDPLGPSPTRASGDPRAMGPADRVTLARATLVGGVTALVATSFTAGVPIAALVSLASAALVLDAVDGPVARRTGTVSALGARFDMEVDAFLIFVLSVCVARDFGAWVLIIGLARYAFVAAGWAWPWLRQPTPPRYWCKVVAAIQGIVLTVVAAGVLPRPVDYLALGLALALLTESFGRDVWWLVRHRPVPVAARRIGSPVLNG